MGGDELESLPRSRKSRGATRPCEPTDLAIGPAYDWCVRALSLIEGRIGLDVRLHGGENIAAGQIFVFNHFTRLETVIPPYLIRRATGAYCRTVAAGNLFEAGPGLARFLAGAGVVPNDLPGLLPFLAAEILRGRKVVIFPEGGMVKDRRVVDDGGRLAVYSRAAHRRRKHHSGAAVIALALDVFKFRILSVHDRGDHGRLERWVKSLGLPSADALLEAARTPTLIVPANITYHPIRVGANALSRGINLLARNPDPRHLEEALIEGNLLFKDTDVDIRLGPPVAPTGASGWLIRRIVDRAFGKIDSLDELFSLALREGRWLERMVSTYLVRESRRLRDLYMRRIYAGVTVNVSHLAARLVMGYVEAGRAEVDPDLFHRALYVAIKEIQKARAVHLHDGIENPEAYDGVLEGRSPAIEDFWATAKASSLIERRPGRCRFLAKLRERPDLDRARLENPVSVYANEVAPVAAVGSAVESAMAGAPRIGRRALARLRFDDERRAFAWCRRAFSDGGIDDGGAAAEPFLLLPRRSNGLGIVLVHGLGATPADLRQFGERLTAVGHPVIGVRLAGHGTPPRDMAGRGWTDWLGSVRRGHGIVAAFAQRVALIGFAEGGALALRLAAESAEGVACTVGVAVPMRIRDTAVRAPRRREMKRMIVDLTRRLADVACPVLLIEPTGDGATDGGDARLIMDRLGPVRKVRRRVAADRQGIGGPDFGGIEREALAFLGSLLSEARAA